MPRRPHLWILRGHTPVPARSIMEWAAHMENIEAIRVGFDVITQPEHDPVQVSTIFLGIDHRYGNGPPILFESLVFGGPLDGEMYRYPTWDAAAAGHKLLVDEAVIEGKVSAWEVREQIKALIDLAKKD